MYRRDDNIVPVYLAREPDTAQDNEFEPQRVRVISNNIGMLQVDSLFRDSGTPWEFMVSFTNYTRGIRRVALNFAQFWLTIPNINIKNNTLVYFDNGDATFKTATLTPGFYNLNTLATELQTALNASVPAPVAPFAVAVNPNQFNLTVTNANQFYFDPTSAFIVRGKFCAGFTESTTLTTSLSSGVCKLFYTDYLVIESQQLSNYTKNVSIGSNDIMSNIVGLVAIDDGSYPHRRSSYYSDKQWIHFFASTQITNLNIRIVDMYGENPEPIALGDPHFEIEIYTQL